MPVPTPPPPIGDAVLDADHARLQELMVQLLNAPTAAAAHALCELRAHAQSHFSAEDEDLRAMNDGAAKCHLDEHAAVLKSLDEVAALLCEAEIETQAKALLTRRLAGQLLSWLPEHVNGMDAAVATYRSKKRFGGAPINIPQRTPR